MSTDTEGLDDPAKVAYRIGQKKKQERHAAINAILADKLDDKTVLHWRALLMTELRQRKIWPYE